MELVSGLSGHWLEAAVAVYLIGMILYGHYRGFIRLAVSMLSFLIAIAAVRFAAPYAMEWIREETGLYDTVKSGMEKAVGVENLVEGDVDSQDVISGLKLPEQLKRMLSENNTEEIYKKMGVELIQDYVGEYLADLVIRILVFLILFLAIFLLLRIVIVWLDLIAKLPILSGLNQIAGAILGGAEGMLLLWIGCLICTMMAGTDWGRSIMNQIDASAWLSWIYDNNFLSALAVGLVCGIL